MASSLTFLHDLANQIEILLLVVLFSFAASVSMAIQLVLQRWHTFSRSIGNLMLLRIKQRALHFT